MNHDLTVLPALELAMAFVPSTASAKFWAFSREKGLAGELVSLGIIYQERSLKTDSEVRQANDMLDKLGLAFRCEDHDIQILAIRPPFAEDEEGVSDVLARVLLLFKEAKIVKIASFEPERA